MEPSTANKPYDIYINLKPNVQMLTPTGPQERSWYSRVILYIKHHVTSYVTIFCKKTDIAPLSEGIITDFKTRIITNGTKADDAELKEAVTVVNATFEHIVANRKDKDALLAKYLIKIDTFFPTEEPKPTEPPKENEPTTADPTGTTPAVPEQLPTQQQPEAPKVPEPQNQAPQAEPEKQPAQPPVQQAPDASKQPEVQPEIQPAIQEQQNQGQQAAEQEKQPAPQDSSQQPQPTQPEVQQAPDASGQPEVQEQTQQKQGEQAASDSSGLEQQQPAPQEETAPATQPAANQVQEDTVQERAGSPIDDSFADLPPLEDDSDELHKVPSYADVARRAQEEEDARVAAALAQQLEAEEAVRQAAAKEAEMRAAHRVAHNGPGVRLAQVSPNAKGQKATISPEETPQKSKGSSRSSGHKGSKKTTGK